ncbi:hypothetical protein BD560DRAFT_428459 [Blakeslea trispora]|nr:hypothetical protein BD560DRAFT_428459 [Blakeslea trispora]
MDDKTRNFMKKLARLANDIETDDIVEHVEKKTSSFENVAIDITESFSLNTLINFSEINGNPIGFERLSESGYVEISWDRRSGTRLSDEDFNCLKLYYERQYADPVSVPNYVERFKQISVLGYVYKSKLCGGDTMVAFNTYRCNDTESDDLDGVDMDCFEEHLRAGEVQYFFRHKVEFVSKYGSKEELIITLLLSSGSKTLAKKRKRKEEILLDHARSEISHTHSSTKDTFYKHYRYGRFP